MKTLMIAALLGTVAAGGVAVAQSSVVPALKLMKGDIDADGRLSRAEFVKRAEAKFALLDSNKDGALTREEARIGRAHGGWHGRSGRLVAPGQDGPPPGAMRGGMMRLDTDGDGKVTRAEYDVRAGQRFARMDVNGDGVIDAAELRAGPMGGRDVGKEPPMATPTPPAPNGA